MSAGSLQITYMEGKPLAAYFYLAGRGATPSVRTKKIRDDLLVDYGEDGLPIGIEILQPGALKWEEIAALIEQLGLEVIERRDLQPVLAA